MSMKSIFSRLTLQAMAGLLACSRQEPPANNPLKEPMKALGKAAAVQQQLQQQADEQRKKLDDAEQ